MWVRMDTAGGAVPSLRPDPLPRARQVTPPAPGQYVQYHLAKALLFHSVKVSHFMRKHYNICCDHIICWPHLKFHVFTNSS